MMNRVYATEGVAPTLRTMATGGNLMPKIEVKGTIGDEGFEYVRKVYGEEGVAPTLLGNNRVNNVPKIETTDSQGGGSDD